MKNRMILAICMLIIANYVCAQRIIITNDSLRNHFQNDIPYRVYIYYQKRFASELDYKGLYYDQQMKGYLMKWLESDTWIDYEVFLYRKELYQFETNQKEALARYYVENNLKLKYDSIRQDTSLLKLYINLSIENIAIKKREEMIKRKSSITPPLDVLLLHKNIAYPEFYKRLKSWWYMQNKQVFIDEYDITETMVCLLSLNDPEAQSTFNGVMKRFFTSNWHPFFGTGTLESLRFVSNAYAIKKLLEILSIKKEIETMSDGSIEPFDKLVYNLLRQFMIEHNLENNPFLSISNDIKEMRKNKEKIIEASERLIKKLEAEEQYWMKNIPYDYVPDLQSADNNQEK